MILMKVDNLLSRGTSMIDRYDFTPLFYSALNVVQVQGLQLV